MNADIEPEPWLRGPIENVPAHLLPVFFSFAQVREDLTTHIQGVSSEELWRNVAGKHSLGYHLKHIAGSVDRLTTYLIAGQLTEAQLEFLKSEHVADLDLQAVIELVHENLRVAEQQLLMIRAEDLFEPRAVGRKLLPTTVLGLLIHVCEHTQRHLGQAILIARLLHV